MQPPQSTHPTRSTFFLLLRQVVPSERLEKYRQLPTDTDLDLFERYLWNIALSEALYCALQNLEVGLRNSIHRTATHHFGRSLWFDMYPSILMPYAHTKIERARRDLRGAAKQEAGRIVAGLDFAFWTSLFNDHYEHLLWRQGNLLREVFPETTPKSLRTRDEMAKRLNKIRDFRNRVFHHEPVCNWRNPSALATVQQQHADILRVLGWISPALVAMVEATDRFPAVYNGGSALYRAQLTRCMRRLPPP